MENVILAALFAALVLLGFILRRLSQGDTMEAGLPAKVTLLESELTTNEKIITQLKDDLDKLRHSKSSIDIELATTKQELEYSKEDAHQKAEILTLQFRKLSDELLKNHGATLKEQNKEQIENLLKPLQVKIVEFEESLTTKHTQSVEQHITLREQIINLDLLNKSMIEEASNLARALKGQTQTQGAWGEMILATILEKSGLRDGVEFVQQESITDAEGRRHRPDVIVNLPDGDRVIIDSKVSLTAFESFINEEDESTKEISLAAHIRSIRAHIDELAKKDYTGVAGSRLDYVIMFIPIEGALAVALREKPDLTIYAMDKNVAMATPTTLMAMLRTVAAMWRTERQNRNAEEIAERAGRLYDKFVNFVESLDHVGQRIDQAKAEFEGARGQLVSGRGNLVRQTEMIKTLGARTKKSFSKDLLEGAEVDSITSESEPISELEATNDG